MRPANHPALFAGLIALGLITTISGSSAAFCRTTTVRPPAEQDGSGQCSTQGVPLYHPSQCLPYRLQTKESAVIPNAELSDKLARAFATWTAPNPKCVPGISAIELAPVDDAAIVGYTTGERGRNVVGVSPTWNHQGGADTLSLATLTFGAESGEVIDVDLEVNGTVPWSFTDEKPTIEGQHDLQTVLTHEVGHVLGLAHSDDPNATMFPSYTPGTIDIRTLEPDDQDGICAIYPNKKQRGAASGLVPSTTCNLAPGNPNGTCANPDISHGCSTSRGAVPAGRTETGIVTTGLLAGLALILSRGLRRRRTTR